MLNPVFQVVVKNTQKSQLQLLLLMLGLSTVGEAIYANLHGQNVFSLFTYWLMASFYFLYGHYFRAVEKSQQRRGWDLAGFILPLLLTLTWVYQIRVMGNFQPTVWESYFGPAVMIASLGLFRWLMAIATYKWNQPTKTWWVKMATAGFGVYLSHGVVMDLLFHTTKVNPYGVMRMSVMSFLILSTLITIGVSLGVSLGLERFRFGRYILGLKR
jgi:hypothetical protein